MESALPRWWLVFLSPGRTGTGRDDASTENGGSVSLFPRALTDSGWPVGELAVVAHVSVVIKQVFCLVVGRFSPQTLYRSFPFPFPFSTWRPTFVSDLTAQQQCFRQLLTPAIGAYQRDNDSEATELMLLEWWFSKPHTILLLPRAASNCGAGHLIGSVHGLSTDK